MKIAQKFDIGHCQIKEKAGLQNVFPIDFVKCRSCINFRSLSCIFSSLVLNVSIYKNNS